MYFLLSKCVGAVKFPNFSGRYRLSNSTLEEVFWHIYWYFLLKENPPEAWHKPLGTTSIHNINMYLYIKNSNVVEKSFCVVITGIITQFIWSCKNTFNTGESTLPIHPTFQTSRSPKFCDLPNLQNFPTSITSQICRPIRPIKIIDLPNLPKFPTSLTSQCSWPS
jgi:hypothetical protein